MLLSENKTNLSYCSIFMMLWCVMILAEYDNLLSWHKTAFSLISVAMAYMGLFYARSKYVMTGVLLFQMLVCLKRMPVVGNHWFFASIISLVLIWPLMTQTIKDRFNRSPIDSTYLQLSFPIIRILVITMYLFAVFHKLNSDFFNPNISCAVHIYQQIIRGGYMFDLPQTPALWVRYALIYGTLFIELLIPLLLMIKRTWFVGIFIGCLFHLMTGAIMRHFPTLMFALYFLFIPPDVAKRSVKYFERIIRRLSGQRVGLIGALIVQSLLWMLWSIVVRIQDTQQGIGHYRWSNEGYLSGQWLLLRVWWVVAMTAFVIWVIFILRNRFDRIQRNDLFGSARTWMYIVPVIFVLNCLSPYFGLKTVSTISMWSNLLTLNYQSNHLLMRGNIFKIFPYMDDMVELKETNVVRWQQKLIDENRLIAYVMLKQQVQNEVKKGKHKVSLTYVRQGKMYRIADASKDPQLMQPNSYFIRKCVHIKNPRKNKIQECTW